MKNSDEYSSMAEVYDLLNDQVDYRRWAEYIDETVRRFESTRSSLMLDLACGTGKMTFEMRRLGYDMTALDISPEMLNEAFLKAQKEGAGDILWLCQDMTEFELYGTVDAVICCLDGINHLTEKSDVEKCFSLVHNYLIPDGIFMFDVNTPHKFDTVYRDRDYVLEDEGVLLAWQNLYDEGSGICEFVTSVFTENEDGSYSREDGVQTERRYDKEELRDLLEKAGFEVLCISGNYGYEPPENDADRWYITARCKK